MFGGQTQRQPSGNLFENKTVTFPQTQVGTQFGNVPKDLNLKQTPSINLIGNQPPK